MHSFNSCHSYYDSKMIEKNFINHQWYQLLFASFIIVMSCILSPCKSESDDRVTFFGFKTPVLCAHRLIFHRPCAGCGLTRSFVSFAHGDIEAAYSYHRLGIPLFILVLIQIPIRLYLLRTGSKGYTSRVKKMIAYPAILVVIALIINWVIFLLQTNVYT